MLASLLDWIIFESELLWRCVIIRWWCMLLLQQKVNRFFFTILLIFILCYEIQMHWIHTWVGATFFCTSSLLLELRWGIKKVPDGATLMGKMSHKDDLWLCVWEINRIDTILLSQARWLARDVFLYFFSARQYLITLSRDRSILFVFGILVSNCDTLKSWLWQSPYGTSGWMFCFKVACLQCDVPSERFTTKWVF